MNISENKRVLALSVLFLAAFGGVAYHGYMRSNDFAAAKAELNEIQDAFDGYNNSEFAPTKESRKALDEAIKKVTKINKELKADMEKYAEVCYGNGKTPKPGEFQNEVREAIARVAALASNSGASVGNPAADLGMAQFKNALAVEKDVPYRSFQLKAVEQVVTDILSAGAPALEKVYCAPVPDEDVRSKATFPLDFEVAFTARRGQLPGILNKIAGNRQYFLMLTGVSVLNSTPLPGIDAYVAPGEQAPAPTTGDDLMGDGGEQQAAAPADTKAIAVRKTGDPNETVRVHLIMQVRFFNPAKAKS